MNIIKSSLIGFITFILIIVNLTIGFGILTIVNIPRIIIPFNAFKIALSKFSNVLGDLTVYGLKLIMLLMHGNTIQVTGNQDGFDKSK